jgi:hypothetical protein
MHNQPIKKRRGQPIALFITTIVGLILASLPVAVPAVQAWQHEAQISSLSYKQAKGYWETISLPEEFRTNTVHAAVLPTGKVLLVAGSGNVRNTFISYHDNNEISVLKTVIYDPETREVKIVPTPSDMFCSGHALLPSGNLLIAGGTSGYELLASDVKSPAGPMIIHNENPDDSPRVLKVGTLFTSPSGKAYRTTQEARILPATKTDFGAGRVLIQHSTTTIFVEAVAESPTYVTSEIQKYTVEGLTGTESNNIYGQGGPMTLKKQDFRGDDKAYEFDPETEQYVKVGDLKESRWYASIPVLTNGDALAVSGLDATGAITDTTERYDPTTKTWSWGPTRAFPTYPALFRTSNPDVLFFSGSNAGYGPKDTGRQPGFWNITTNEFSTVNGLRDSNLLETSGSVMLPPKKGSNDGSQSSSIMVAGGGGIGESADATKRTDIIDLSNPNPQFKPGVDLPDALRYINLTVTPWDDVFINGGSKDYRAKENTYSFKSGMLDATNQELTPVADEIIGRSYHSGSLLLEDGRILVFGSDP